MSGCRAVLNLRGEHYPCDMECVDAYGEPTQGHEGWAHANREAQAIWIGPEERDRIEGLQDRMQEQEQRLSGEDWISGRGLTYGPEREGTPYGGHISVQESSMAEGPHVWIRAVAAEINDSGGEDAAVHLTVEQARRFAEDIIRICRNHYQTREEPG